MTAKRPKRSECPISRALDLVGDRWTLLIVRDLTFGGGRSFRDLAEADEEIATNVLSDRLERLVCDGLVVKARMKSDRRQFLYSLTEKGISLAPLLVQMALWGNEHGLEKKPGPLLRKMRANPEQFIAELRENWKRNRKEMNDLTEQ